MMNSCVHHLSFYSPGLGRDVKYCIYLPPSYYKNEHLRYSTVYLLPGLMDYERTWCDKGRVHEHMDNLIYNGKIGEMILVMPDKGQEALEPEHQKGYASYLGRDLVGYIDNSFRTIAHRSHRGIEGLSLGASWAIRMAAYFPETFSSVSCLSGGFSPEIYRAFSEKKDYFHNLGFRFRIGVGAAEPEFIEGNQNFANFLKDLGFYCEFALDEGPHDWPLWVKQIYNSLQFHYYSFNP